MAKDLNGEDKRAAPCGGHSRALFGKLEVRYVECEPIARDHAPVDPEEVCERGRLRGGCVSEGDGVRFDDLGGAGDGGSVDVGGGAQIDTYCAS